MQQPFFCNAYSAVLFQKQLVFLIFGITAASRLSVRSGVANIPNQVVHQADAYLRFLYSKKSD